jgi:hypothetical protein
LTATFWMITILGCRSIASVYTSVARYKNRE